jgi:methyltransferase
VTKLLIAGAIVFAFLIVEARRAARNERLQRAAGAVEPPDDVYQLMRVAYPGGFALMLAEGALRGGAAPSAFAAGAVLFTLGKALKWWAIATLGPRWTFRVLVRPGVPLVASGPYRWLRHPNYVGVVGELTGLTLMTAAWVAGPVVTIGFVALMIRRIRVEMSALTGSATDKKRPKMLKTRQI